MARSTSPVSRLSDRRFGVGTTARATPGACWSRRWTSVGKTSASNRSGETMRKVRLACSGSKG